MRLLPILLAISLLVPSLVRASERLTLASTTSTENSGLFRHILPLFQQATGISVRVVAVGTGQALNLGMKGDADILLVHHPDSEKRFVAEGFGTGRYPVMYNDFVLIGPSEDPADVGKAVDAIEALERIASHGALFASRGDESGTHKAEQALWHAAGSQPSAARESWYREMGAGMGATLNAAIALDAYALTDRATWLGFANRGTHRIMFQGDPALFNQYAVLPVNPARHPHINATAARKLLKWLRSDEGQRAIASFRLGGKQVFFPNAK